MERVRAVDGAPRLVGGRCAACGHSTFPYRDRCPACRAEATPDEAALAPDGVVQSAVELHVSTEEWEAPYTLGIVRLDDGVTLLARVDGAAETGTRVHLAADDGGDRFWFAVVEHAHALSDQPPPDGGERS